MELKHKHKEGVQLFVNKELELEVRAVEINGEGWLVGKDVAEALGYKNTRKAILDHVDIEDKDLHNIPTSGGKQTVTIIKEKGVIRLIQKSKVKSLEYKTDFINWLISNNLISDSVIIETRKEIEFLSTLEKILKPMNYSLQQQLVDGAYKLDGYISELDLVIEYDENGHKHYDQAKERIREAYIKNKYKHLIRVTDKTDLYTNIGIVMNKINDILPLIEN